MSFEQEEGEKDYFASMTDMVVGVLFIFIIMVAYFAFQVSNEDSVPLSLYEAEQKKNKALMVDVDRLELKVKELEEEIKRLRRLLKEKDPMVAYIENATDARNDIVSDVIKELKKYGIDAKSYQKGVVTISGKGLFANSRSDLSSVIGAEQRVKYLSEVLVERMSCFVLEPKPKIVLAKGLVTKKQVLLSGDGSLVVDGNNNPVKLIEGKNKIKPTNKVSINALGAFKADYNSCNANYVFIESVYIEGHTDNVPITKGRVLKDGSRNNLELSARRATNTYGLIASHRPESLQMVNPSGQQVLSVAAYGKQRPIDINSDRAGRQNNRRIDIRFVMHVPKNQLALETFVASFKDPE